MKQKLFSLLFAIVASFGTMFASVTIGGITYNLDETELTAEVTSSEDNYSGSIVIPESVSYETITYSVTSIGAFAFSGCSSLTSVTIPNSVTSIGQNPFLACKNLVEISVDARNTVYDSRDNCNAIIETASNKLISGCQNTIIPNSTAVIGYAAFHQQENLKSIIIPFSVTQIELAAFSSSGITSIVIPAQTFVEDWYYSDSEMFGVFASCQALTDVTLLEGVTKIANGEFSNCRNLQTIHIPESVASIGKCAFLNCSNLTSVTLPNSITSIGNCAFMSSGLTSVSIPNSVTSIGVWAFNSCSSLTSITSEATNPPTLESDVFINVDKSIPLYVPAESIDAYKAAEQWKDFTIILPIPAASVAISSYEDPQHVGTYYSTFYYSSGHYELPAAGVEAFVATVSGSEMNLTRIAGGAGVIPQGTAVILRSNIQNYTLTLSDDAPAFNGSNVLQGVDIATTTPANCYVLSAVDGVVGFYQYTGEQVGAHKAYLVYNGAGAPRRMRFVFDEENAATGIDEMEQPYMDVQKRIENGQLIIIRDGVRYNAQGQIVK